MVEPDDEQEDEYASTYDPQVDPAELPPETPPPEEAEFEQKPWTENGAYRAAALRGAIVGGGVAVFLGALASFTSGAGAGVSMLLLGLAIGVLTALSALFEFALERRELSVLSLWARLAVLGAALTVGAIGAGIQSTVNLKVLDKGMTFAAAFEHALDRLVEGRAEGSSLFLAWIGVALTAAVGARLGRFTLRWQIATVWIVTQAFVVVLYTKQVAPVSILFVPLAALCLPVACQLSDHRRVAVPLLTPGFPKRALPALLGILLALIGGRVSLGVGGTPLPPLTASSASHISFGSSSMAFGAVSADGTRLLTGSHSGSISLWELNFSTGDLSRLDSEDVPVAEGQDRVSPSAAAFSEDNRWAVVGDDDGDLHLFGLKGDELVAVGSPVRLGEKGQKPVGQPYKVSSAFDDVASVALAGDRAIAGYDSGRVIVWRLTPQGLTQPRALVKSDVRSVALAHGGRFAFVAGWRGVMIYDLEASPEATPRYYLPDGPKTVLHAQAWSADGETLFTSTLKGIHAANFDLETGTLSERGLILGAPPEARSLWTSRGGDWLLGRVDHKILLGNGSSTRHTERGVRLWRLETQTDGSLRARYATTFPSDPIHVAFDESTGWAVATQSRDAAVHTVDLFGDRDIEIWREWGSVHYSRRPIGEQTVRWSGSPLPPAKPATLRVTAKTTQSGPVPKGQQLGVEVTASCTSESPATWVTARVTVPAGVFAERVAPPLLLGTIGPGESVTATVFLTPSKTLNEPVELKVELSDQWGATSEPFTFTR